MVWAWRASCWPAARTRWRNGPPTRSRNKRLLKTLSSPRIPIPGTRKVFDALAQLGSKLVAWHLLEHPAALKISALKSIGTGGPAWFGSDFTLQKVAEKSRALAEVSGTADPMGKVFVNATSGFANVRLPVWQHTIGGYQVLHKWLDDRRKARRSLSTDDVTHWLRVYAALEATQALMLQVDDAIESCGGWPSAFSQNHPPPNATTLALEQVAQKEQSKAQKKAAKATRSKAAPVSPTGATSLFDFDDDLDALAEAAGAPPRPKSRATPAKAAGGKAAGTAKRVVDITDGQAMCSIRRVLAGTGSDGLNRQVLMRASATELGFARMSPALKKLLDDAIRRAVRRGIAQNKGGLLSLLVRDINGYDRDHLKAQLLAAIRAAGGTCPRSDAPTLLARTLGYARTVANNTTTTDSILRSLIRAKRVESKAGQIRVLR